MTNHQLTLSICVCTSGRARELTRCLDSVAAGTRLPLEVVVSDDSRDETSAAAIRDVCTKYSFARYIEGPQRGLCANRNGVVKIASGSHISLLDDDACVSPDFVGRVLDLLGRAPNHTVFTGDVLEDGIRLTPPTNPTFLGHFGRMVRAGEPLKNINLNCNVFPREAFDVAKFDESITYGYEDTDLCAQLIAGGFRIVHIPELVNSHLPPTKNAAEIRNRLWQAERARFYTSLRRHMRWQRSVLSTLAFLAIAPVHLFVHALRARRFNDMAAGWYWAAQDILRAGK